MGAGMIIMKLFDKLLNKPKESKDLKAQDLANENTMVDNFEKLNNLLFKQLEVNVTRYADLLNVVITIRGENEKLHGQVEENESLKRENKTLKEQVLEFVSEVKSLNKALKDFEFEIQTLKEYIKNKLKPKL